MFACVLNILCMALQVHAEKDACVGILMQLVDQVLCCSNVGIEARRSCNYTRLWIFSNIIN